MLGLSKAQAENAAELMSLAKNFLLTHLEPQLKQPQVVVSPLSTTAQKPQCANTPQVSYSGKQRVGNVTLIISCTQPAWQQYMSAKVTGLLPAIIAQQDINAGQVLDESWVMIEWKPNNQVTLNHLRELHSVQQKTARQFIAKGTSLQQHQLKSTLLIQKNDLVRIVSADPRFHIEMNGMALEAGYLGQAIRVKNLSSGKTIKAYVDSADSVSVR